MRHWVFGGGDGNGQRILRGSDDLARVGVTVYSALKSRADRADFFERVNSVGDEELAAAFVTTLCKTLRSARRAHKDPEASAWLASNDLGARLVSLLEAEMAPPPAAEGEG